MFDLERIKGAGLEAALRQMPVAAFIAEAPSGRILLVNQQARRLIERNPGRPMPPEIEGHGELKVFHLDGRPLEMDEWPLVKSIASGEEVTDEEYSYPLADGTRLTLSCSSSPIRDDEGNIVAGILIVHDITERKRMEQELREREERLDATFEQAAVGMSHTAPDGTLHRVNRKMCDILGYTREEMLGMKVRERTHPDDLEKDLEEAGRLLAGEIETYSMEKRLLRKDDSVVWIKLTISLVRKPSGEPDYLIAVCEDIDERKRDEEQIAYHAHLLENVHDAVIATDERFVVRAWNRAAEEMYGWRADEAMGRRIREVVPSEQSDERWAGVRKELDETGHFRDEWITRRRDGEPIHVEVTAVALRDDRGEISGYLSIDRDITERKRFEEEQKLLADIVQNSSEFIGISDLDMNVTFVNEAGQRIVGLNGMEEVRMTSVQDYFMPEDRAFVRDEVYVRTLEEGRWVGEIDFRHFQTGEPIPVLWDQFRIDDPATGQPISLATVARDITERKQAEEELREGEERLRFALEAASLGAWRIDLEPYELSASDTCKANFGLPPDSDFTLETLFSLIYPGERARVRALIESAISTGEDYEADYQIATPSGEARCISARGRMARASDGSPSHLAGVTLDITKRKRDEEEITTRVRQQEAVARLGQRALANDGLKPLMDEAVDSVVRTLGVEFCKIVELLPSGEELLMRSGAGWEEGVVGSSGSLDPQASFTLDSEEPVIIEDLWEESRFRPAPLLEEHGIVSGMLVAIPGQDGPFGAMGAHTATRRAFTHDDANFLQAVANVLGAAVERKAADERLSEVREAERSRMARDLHDEALGDLAHAISQAQIAQAALEDPRLVRRMESLTESLKRTGRQVRSAVHGLRLGQERDKSFRELLEPLVELHRAMNPDCDIRLEMEDGGLGEPLGKVGTELLRISEEALTNIRRHSGAKNVWVSVGISEGMLRADISDDGLGFDPEESYAAPGLGGMGIKGMRERARSLEGRLEIRSQPREGAKVMLELPLKQGHREPVEEELHQEVRALLVEDHATVREAIASSFEGETGFHIVGQAASLAEARRILGAEEVDVAIVDLGLPDGYRGDLIRNLQETNPKAQALVLSANLSRVEMARAVEAGAAGVLHKTAHLDEVVQAVRRLRAGETLLPLEEVVGLLRFAGSRREEEYEARRKIESLTPREKEVLQALADGLDSKEVAERLHISLRTERNHVSSILAKLGVHSQLQALVFALRHGVVEIP